MVWREGFGAVGCAGGGGEGVGVDFWSGGVGGGEGGEGSGVVRWGEAAFGVFVLEAFDHAGEGRVEELETSLGSVSICWGRG